MSRRSLAAAWRCAPQPVGWSNGHRGARPPSIRLVARITATRGVFTASDIEAANSDRTIKALGTHKRERPLAGHNGLGRAGNGAGPRLVTRPRLPPIAFRAPGRLRPSARSPHPENRRFPFRPRTPSAPGSGTPRHPSIVTQRQPPSRRRHPPLAAGPRAPILRYDTAGKVRNPAWR